MLSDSKHARPDPIPARAGIGLRGPHSIELLERLPDIGFLEIHSENYFGAGGIPLNLIDRLREHYPVSVHGVGLSIGSTDPLDLEHLRRLSQLISRVEPGLISEHLSWGSVTGIHLNDLLPLPYTEEAVSHVSARIDEIQDSLKRRLLIENVSSYLQFSHSVMPEWEFLVEVAKRSGCGILLDVNNVYVSARNHEFNPHTYLDAIPAHAVKEIHLAGFAVNEYAEGKILIDHHGARVSDAVWALYRKALTRFGGVPTLIEWDTDIPSLDVLLAEARTAEGYMNEHRALAA